MYVFEFNDSFELCMYYITLYYSDNNRIITMAEQNVNFDFICSEYTPSTIVSKDLCKSDDKFKMECSNEKYKIYNNRIDSFKSWPSSEKIDPQMLAKAGLYYSGFNELCICAWCGVKLNNGKIMITLLMNIKKLKKKMFFSDYDNDVLILYIIFFCKYY